MGQRERLEGIRTLVKTEKRVVVSELSRQFEVTEETIRRDLEKLEGEGLVARTYGGAVLSMGDAAVRVSYVRRSQTNVEEKRAIARIAAELIPNHSAAIGADSSSTVMETIHLLGDREDLIVMTYSANILREMADANIQIMSTGGLLNKKSSFLQGVIARNTLKNYHMDVVLVSCNGLQLNGVFDTDENEAEIKRLMVAQGQKVYLLVDHTKFGRLAFAKLFELDQVDTVITDRYPGDEWADRFAASKIELLYPGKE